MVLSRLCASCHPCEAKITDFQIAIGIDKKISGFDIPKVKVSS